MWRGNSGVVGSAVTSQGKSGVLLFVTTPSSLMMFGLSNCPIMLASRRKSRLWRSVYPPFKVFMATGISFFPGVRSRPLHTSPNSPGKHTHTQTHHTHKTHASSVHKCGVFLPHVTTTVQSLDGSSIIIEIGFILYYCIKVCILIIRQIGINIRHKNIFK